jgi:hypothetical protein
MEIGVPLPKCDNGRFASPNEVAFLSIYSLGFKLAVRSAGCPIVARCDRQSPKSKDTVEFPSPPDKNVEP